MARPKTNPFELLQAEYLKGKAAGDWSSQREFAEKLGVRPCTAFSWLQGLKRPSWRNACMLERRLGIDSQLWLEAA